MTGKEKCALLREIRIRLAKANDIPYEPEVCLHGGDCKGTCYTCDCEAKDLTQKIKQKKREGHTISWDVVNVNQNMCSSTKVNFQDKDGEVFGHMFGPPNKGRISEYRKNEPNTFPLIGIERLRINTDGPGIRALIAVHGCPLRCKFCINPSAVYTENWDVYTPQDVYEAIKDDAVYYRSTNGGVTFGGGEPLMYPEFINEVGKLLPKGLNRWCETSLNVPLENIIACEAAIDHFAVDIKTLSPDIYWAYTGGELSRVLENLNWLSQKRGTDAITLRIPIIPGFTNEADQQYAMKYFRNRGFANIDEFTYITDGI